MGKKMNNVTEMFYEQINVYKRKCNLLCVYRCFKSLTNNKFYVQSMDTFYEPIDKEQIRNSELQLFDLFLDDDIVDRCESFDCLKSAIIAFDNDFK